MILARVRFVVLLVAVVIVGCGGSYEKGCVRGSDGSNECGQRALAWCAAPHRHDRDSFEDCVRLGKTPTPTGTPTRTPTPVVTPAPIETAVRTLAALCIDRMDRGLSGPAPPDVTVAVDDLIAAYDTDPSWVGSTRLMENARSNLRDGCGIDQADRVRRAVLAP